MREEVKVVQRFGTKNRDYLMRFWKLRNAMMYIGDITNERILKIRN